MSLKKKKKVYDFLDFENSVSCANSVYKTDVLKCSDLIRQITFRKIQTNILPNKLPRGTWSTKV
nr:unnamed protein product [Callosobruchus analis]